MLDRPSPAACVFGPFEFLPNKRLLLRDGASTPLTPKAFDTLTFLIENRDRVVPKDELLRHVWPDVTVEEGNLTQQIFLLRKALEDSSDGQQYIATIPRVGYRFVGTIVDGGSPDAPTAAVTGSKHGWTSPLSIVAAGLALAALAASMIVTATRRSAAPSPQYTFRRLTSDPGVESFPSLSPEGLLFVYASGPIDYPGPSRIYLGRVDQDAPIANLSGDGPVSDTQPAFSPDGKWIAFRSDRLRGGLFRIPSGGGQPLLIVNEGFNPSWSPDGKRIVYSTFSHGASPYARRKGGQLRIVDVASGVRTPLDTGEALQPAWSPHGDRIAYWGDRSSPRITTSSAIFTVSASASSDVPILATGNAPGLRTEDWDPSWSPDGRYLYFSSNRSGTIGLWRVPIDERTGSPRGNLEPVPTPSTFAAHVSFGHASDRFLFASLPMRTSIQRLP